MNHEKIKQAVTLFLEGIGEDTDREGLQDTPERIANMCEEIFAGLGQNASEHLSKTFSSDYKDMVLELSLIHISEPTRH